MNMIKESNSEFIWAFLFVHIPAPEFPGFYDTCSGLDTCDLAKE